MERIIVVPMPNKAPKYNEEYIKNNPITKLSIGDRPIRLYRGFDVFVTPNEYEILWSDKSLLNEVKQLWSQYEVDRFLMDLIENNDNLNK